MTFPRIIHKIILKSLDFSFFCLFYWLEVAIFAP